VTTFLAGHLYAALQGDARAITVFDFRGGVKGDQLCAAESDAGGSWICDVGPLFGDFLVVVDPPGGSGLRAVVDDVMLGEMRTIEVSPVTELVAAYVDHLGKAGVAPKDAYAKARRLIYGHFGSIDFDRIRAAPLDSSVVSLTDEAVSAVVLVSFDQLARDIAAASGLSANGLVSEWILISMLSDDIAADGVFNGIGSTGRLYAATAALDGETLRGAFGRSMLAWLGGQENSTALHADDFRPIATAIAADASEIFPAGTPEPLDNRGPRIGRFVVHAGMRDVGPSDPARADLRVELSATAPAGTARIDLLIDGTSEGAEVIDEHSGYKLWQIHTLAFADGPHTVRADVSDTRGATTSIERPLIVDNTPPALTATAAGIVGAPTVRVTGTAIDAIGPVVEIALVGGAATATLADPPEAFALAIEVPCDATWPIGVHAFDAAGNVTTATVTVRCDSTPPVIGWNPSLFRQESTLEATYSPDGTQISYAFAPGAADYVELGGATTATLTKYFNRLDASSDNLPVYRFWANDAEGGVRVDYRYLVNGEPMRDWTPLRPTMVTPSRSEFELPVSYQTLTATLASAIDHLHQIDLRATDDAGNTSLLSAAFRIALRSPPVWFGDCALDPSLSSYTLPGQTLDALYRQPSVPVARGALRFLTGLGPTSLAPRGGILVSIAPGGALSRIIELSEDRHDGLTADSWTDIDLWCPPDIWRGTTKIGPDDQSLGSCTVPETPIDHVALDVSPGSSVNDAETEALVASLADPSGALLPELSTGEIEAVADGFNTLVLALDRPAIHFQGVPYDWSTSFSIPPGFVSRSAARRYRVPSGNRVGFNYETNQTTDWLTYPFVTRAYMSAFEIDVLPSALTVRSPSMPTVPIEVQVMPECSGTLAYTTRL
jgi:hypothetical protein